MEQTRNIGTDCFLTLVRSACIASTVLGCSGSDSVTTTPSIGEVALPNVIVCRQDDEPGGQELYVLRAINRKLSSYPELAAAFGLVEVRTCEEARAFRTSYYDYLAAHPDFDADQELGALPDAAFSAPSTEGPRPTLETSKILGGVRPLSAYPNQPVVNLLRTRTNPPSVLTKQCTGTFIARNWILTAAHCLPPTTSQSIPEQSATGADLTGYPVDHEWQVDWPDLAGAPVCGDLVAGDCPPTAAYARIRSNAPNLLQIAHPDYMGSDFTQHDLALLYLNPHFYDEVLPANVHDNGAARISLSPPLSADHPDETNFVAGYSSPPGPGQPPPPLGTFLRTGVTRVNRVETFRLLARILSFPAPEGGDPTVPPPQDTQAATCIGDSGGPLYRLSNVLLRTTPNDAGSVRTVPVVEGVLSGTDPLATNPNPRPGCSQVGDDDIWTRADGAQDAFFDKRLGFIKDTVESWNGEGTCHTGRLDGENTDDFVQCWGTKPCKQDADCTETEFCSRPGGARDDQSCQVCLGSCDCIMGECQAKP